MKRYARVAAVLLLATAAVPGRLAAAGVAAGPGYLRPVKGPIIRHFEPPPTPYAAGHRGIDMAVPLGTPVVSANDGIVSFAGPVATELFVSIDHADGIRTTYSFLSAISVNKGATVSRGEAIGLSGPGHAGSTQPHLHFGARVGDVYIDPEPLLLDGLRRDVSQAIRLVPSSSAAAFVPARASILVRGRGAIRYRAQRP